MKKNFAKKLAAALSLTLVASLVVPVVPASAATAPDLASRRTYVYEGKDYSYTAINAKGYTVKWSVSGEGAEFVDLSATKGTKTTLTVDTKGDAAAKLAPVDVKAKFYKGSKLIKTRTDNVNIKVSATDVAITNTATVAAGETLNFDRTLTPVNATSKTYWTVTAKDGTATTGAAIDATGNFVANKVGDYKVVATVRNAKDSAILDTAVQDVKATLAIKSVVQTEKAKLDVTFNDDMKDAKLADFSIVKDDTKEVIAVKGITVDGKKVTVETFAGMNDAKSYTVTYKEASKKFTATDNKVTQLTISTATVPFETATEVSVDAKDVNGVKLGTYKLDETEAKLDFSITTTDGYTTGNKLVLFKVGNTAKVKATWHTFEYDANGNEIGAITAEGTITAVDKTAVTVKSYKYTVATDTPSNWDTVETKSNLAIGDTGYEVYLKVVNSTDANTSNDYTLESSNKDVLLVGTKTSETNDIYASVVAVAAGSAYVLVKNSDGNVVWSLPVTIVAERKAASLEVTPTAFTLSNSVAAAQTQDVTVKVNDQYATELTSATTSDKIKVENLSTSATGLTKDIVNATASSYFTIAAGKVTFKGASVVAGTYVYKVTVGDFSKVVTVTVKTPDATATQIYQLVISSNKVDTKFEKAADAKDITIKVGVLQGGVVASYAAISGPAIVIKKDGNVVTGAAISGSAVTFTASSLNGNDVVKAATGSYTVAITVDGVTLNGGFVIEDTQPGLVATRVSTTVDVTDPATDIKAGVVGAFKFVYNGKELTGLTSTSIVSVSETHVGNTYNVKSVTVKVPVVDGATTYYVPATVNLGLTITLN